MPPFDWMTADWPAPACVRTLLTTRNGGTSGAPYDSMNLGTRVGDQPEAVAENRRELMRLLPDAPRWLHQVHGTRVVEASVMQADEPADGCVARTVGTVCGILVADCLPVLLCDRTGSVVAAAHAGWRGLSAGVLEETVRQLRVSPAQLLAFIGPGIGRNAFEVGTDVFTAFVNADAGAAVHFSPKTPGPNGEPKWYCDLAGLAHRRLRGIGVHDVSGGSSCTYSDPARFFSHRRDRRTGRQAALIWLEP
jgi:polyphenol oxidase